MPPSTTSSHTRSAAFSPDCGRASTEFSIFTASAGRSRSASSSPATPVSGQGTRCGGEGTGAAEVVVGALATRAGAPNDAQPAAVVTTSPKPRVARTQRRPTAFRATLALPGDEGRGDGEDD